MQSQQLLQSLRTQTRELLQRAQQLHKLNPEVLRFRPAEKSWSVLECIEHLNRYGNYYLPEIRIALRQAKHPPETKFKTGLLGNYFAESMLPKEKRNAMKTFSSKNPLHAPLDESAIAIFLEQQTELLNLLEQATQVSLNRTKIKTSISPLLRLNLGDTFRFYINHMIRHFAQIDRILLQS